MTLRTPRSSALLWVAGFGLWFGIIPVLNYDSWLYYAEGGTSVDGPAMMLTAAFFSSILLLPGLVAFLACYLVRYRGEAPLLRWKTRRPLPILLSLIATALSLFFLWCIAWCVDFWKLSRIPFVAYLLAWAIYLQYLRASALQRSEPAA